jgi:alpha-1,6-mannosyltransferase
MMGGVMLACFVSMTRLEHFTREGTHYLLLLLVAFIAYGVITWRVIRDPTVPLLLIVIGAILFRIPLLTSTPTLSTDVWRYVWDGRLINEGVNPYKYRVDSEELADLRTDINPRIEHQWMASPYPPVAQGVFAAGYAILPDNPTVMQFLFMFFDLLTMMLLIHFLRFLERPPALVLLYAWNPLMVVEFAHGAHVDSLMTFLTLLAIYFTVTHQQVRSVLALVLATLTKFIPALLLPIFIMRWGLRKSLLYGVLVGLAFIPFMSAGINQDGTGILGAAQIYASEWNTNAGLFYWLAQALQTLSADPGRRARLITRGTLLLGAALIMGYKWSAQQNHDEKSSSTQVVIPAVLLINLYLLLAHAMFPWYLTWLLALIPLLPLKDNPAMRWWAAGWLYFSAAVNLSYLFYLDPANPGERLWIRLVEYIPLYILLGISSVYVVLPLLFEKLGQRHQKHRSAANSE